MTRTISVSEHRYEDEDDCQTAAEADYIAERPDAAGWTRGARGADGERDNILLDVPT